MWKNQFRTDSKKRNITESWEPNFPMDSEIHLAQNKMEFHAELVSNCDLEPVKRFRLERVGLFM